MPVINLTTPASALSPGSSSGSIAVYVYNDDDVDPAYERALGAVLCVGPVSPDSGGGLTLPAELEFNKYQTLYLPTA